jgi:hypothetical protein
MSQNEFEMQLWRSVLLQNETIRCDADEYLPWGERVRPNRARTRSTVRLKKMAVF